MNLTTGQIILCLFAAREAEERARASAKIYCRLHQAADETDEMAEAIAYANLCTP